MERMTSSGRRWAFFVGIFIALALPKQVERGVVVHGKARCTHYVTLPLGGYLAERALGRPTGIAYSANDECR
mgnify:CR=1 FL=1